MTILSVTWGWYPTGGDWTYVENINKLYIQNGFKVIPFSTHNPKNIPTPYSNYFVNSYDFKELNKNKSITNGIKAIQSSIVSKDALQKLKELLRVEKIDIAHLHNIHHHITPAIIKVLKEHNIKIIWSLHDYKILCPENSFVSNGKVCEKCLNGAFYQCAFNKCKKNSILASTLATIEAYYYRKQNIYNLVDIFLCPSEFLYKKFVEGGFPKEKLVLSNYCYDINLINNFIDENKVEINTDNNYILYVGRLEKIKGIETLIKAVKNTNIPLKIVGGGSEENTFKQYIIEEKIKNVEFLGFKNKQEVFQLTYNAKFTICPSEWYENFPFSIIETFLLGKPVIGSRMGGIPELVLHNETGLLFEAGNHIELNEKITELWNNNELITKFGSKAKKHAYNLVNFATHWEKIDHVIKNLN